LKICELAEVLESDINNAIDAIMKFNDAPDRPHSQKFEHHQKHKIDNSHNRRRKDENGVSYPSIEAEKEIIYHKITSLTQ